MATECTQESVLDFLLENGGRVKNKDLVAHFKVVLNSENTKRAVLKERFKCFVDNIAYVKQENAEKVVCLKKKYRYPGTRSGRAQDDDDINRGVNALHLEKNLSVHEEISDLNPKSQELSVIERHCELSDETVHDVIQANALELSNAQSTGEAESRAGVDTASVTPQVIIISRRSLLAASEDGAREGHTEDGSTPKYSRKNFIELMMSSSPQVGQVLMHIQECNACNNNNGIHTTHAKAHNACNV